MEAIINRPDTDIDRVFGRGRLRMATGSHAEVFREESQPGQTRRYSKRFLVTDAGDFRPWTEREGRILASLAGLGISRVARVEERGEADPPELLRTRDAGVTVDHWATLLPVQRDGEQFRHVFEDCAHWWALARHCMMALETLHALDFVHLDLKADNVCIPVSPPDFDPEVPGATMTLCFDQLALIDFAFSLAPGEAWSQPLPMAAQPVYAYQSPCLLSALEAGRQGDLAPTLQLDWRCDAFSLAAMLRRYLPYPEASPESGWTPWRLEQARALIQGLLEAHDADEPARKPHRALIALTKEVLADAQISASLRRGWTVVAPAAGLASDLGTPVTRVTDSVGNRVGNSSLPRTEHEWVSPAARPPAAPAPARLAVRMPRWIAVVTVAAVGALLVAGWWAMEPRLSSERDAAAALQAAANAMGTGLSLSAPKAASVASAAALPLEILQPIEAALPGPMPVGVATVPATKRVAAAPPKTAPSARKVTALPARPAPAVGRSSVDEAERKRALEWLSKRGPAPQPGMTMPPPPGPASAAPPNR